MIKPGFYKHFKGGYVLVLATAKHSDRDEIEVVYVGLNNGKYYARPLESFNEFVLAQNGEKTARFLYVSKKEVEHLLNKEIEILYETFCIK